MVGTALRGVLEPWWATPMQASSENNSNLLVYVVAFFLTTLGIVYVQEAERRIPMNYAQRSRISRLNNQSYLPFKARSSPPPPPLPRLLFCPRLQLPCGGLNPTFFSSSTLAST